MIELCLIVFGIVGTFCYDVPTGYTPPGQCFDNICYVEPNELEIRASWYNPEIGYGKEWNINCQHPCHVLGDGTEVSESFGLFAACPVDWYGKELYFPELDQTRQCRDTGTAIIPTCREVFIPEAGREYHCFIPVDFLEKEQPYFAYLLLDWYGTKPTYNNLIKLE